MHEGSPVQKCLWIERNYTLTGEVRKGASGPWQSFDLTYTSPDYWHDASRSSLAIDKLLGRCPAATRMIAMAVVDILKTTGGGVTEKGGKYRQRVKVFLRHL